MDRKYIRRCVKCGQQIDNYRLHCRGPNGWIHLSCPKVKDKKTPDKDKKTPDKK